MLNIYARKTWVCYCQSLIPHQHWNWIFSRNEIQEGLNKLRDTVPTGTANLNTGLQKVLTSRVLRIHLLYNLFRVWLGHCTSFIQYSSLCFRQMSRLQRSSQKVSFLLNSRISDLDHKQTSKAVRFTASHLGQLVALPFLNKLFAISVLLFTPLSSEDEIYLTEMTVE